MSYVTDFEELQGSPTIRASRKELSGTRLFKILWSEWPAFLGQLWGYWLAIGGNLQFFPGSSFYGLPGMWPSDISVEPFQPDSPLPSLISLAGYQVNYNYAKVTVVYRPFPQGDSRLPGIPSGTFLVASGDIGAQQMTLPGRAWKWPDGTIVDDDAHPGVMIPEETIHLSWRWVPQPPWTAMRTCRGSVNNATFMGYAAGQVLFMGTIWESEFQINQTPLWRIDYRFAAKTVQSTVTPGTIYGHNYFYRDAAGAGNDKWQQIASEGTPPFPSADLTQLFQFGS